VTIDPIALPPLREVIRSHGLDARKALGQNFLLDGNLTARIARTAGDLTGSSVIEVGPGPGGLTRALLAAGALRVVAIERDERCVTALALDLAQLAPPPRRIVANLPYNIATVLLLRWLKQIGEYDSLTLMFQKEVAERLVAVPRSKSYGRLSVMTQWLTQPKAMFDIPPRAFVPAPKIVSTVVQLIPRPNPLAPADPATLERVTAAAFGQRRKMLRQSLKPLGDPETLFAATGIVGTQRAEELDVIAFCALARAVTLAG
jgi:16S rRNA (adenine1518-N6/adenine1519-N6)-dimethyltransferase